MVVVDVATLAHAFGVLWQIRVFALGCHLAVSSDGMVALAAVAFGVMFLIGVLTIYYFIDLRGLSLGGFLSLALLAAEAALAVASARV